MNCTIQQEFVLNVWLNIYDEGAYAIILCHQCHDSIYTGCNFIFQLHKVNNLGIPRHPALPNRIIESKTAIIVKICVVNIFHFVVGLRLFCAFNQCNIGGWRVNILIFDGSFNLSMYRIYFHLYMTSRCVAV